MAEEGRSGGAVYLQLTLEFSRPLLPTARRTTLQRRQNPRPCTALPFLGPVRPCSGSPSCRCWRGSHRAPVRAAQAQEPFVRPGGARRGPRSPRRCCAGRQNHLRDRRVRAPRPLTLFPGGRRAARWRRCIPRRRHGICSAEHCVLGAPCVQCFDPGLDLLRARLSAPGAVPVHWTGHAVQILNRRAPL